MRGEKKNTGYLASLKLCISQSANESANESANVALMLRAQVSMCKALIAACNRTDKDEICLSFCRWLAQYQ